MIVAAHNAAREAVAEDRDRSGTSEGYAAHFARIYQAIRAAIEADRQPSEPAPDPRLDAGTEPPLLLLSQEKTGRSVRRRTASWNLDDRRAAPRLSR